MPSPTSDAPVLEVSDLTVDYGVRNRRHRALSGVSLSVGPGETLGLIGETGSGKSTLARAVLGLVAPTSGSVRVGGEDVTRYSARQWRAFRRRGVVQYVFQDPLRSLDPDLTIEESLTEPLLLRGDPRAQALGAAREQLERVNLDRDLLRRLPGELSGGQRQRVAVARALVVEPRLILLDEPVSALDAANRVQVLQIIKNLRDAGTTLVFISHDLGSVAGVADRVAVLYQGAPAEQGATADVLRAPQHPYTRLLLGSVPTLHAPSASRAERQALRAQLTRSSEKSEEGVPA
ncbi:ABC transporter ATP-binding protein [Kineosporia succinea]|uniref:ABC-type microcin C transport system duplicated ATPase subunit YejF n=1 Tax=Kineosporia succinea TaxID=84632 RepID=A0ABT9P8U9_9ACTN|nr:ABC transporter ATP-binding protein [Kineosporia succinea]MDP9829119.1 ABC-type microcin C transport system duplicated ATPase subunit YejF [Kineosporia succinea]